MRSNGSFSINIVISFVTFAFAILLVVFCSILLGVLIPRQTDTEHSLRDLTECIANGACVGGNLVLHSLILEENIVAPNIPSNGTCITSINGVGPDNTTFNVDLIPGTNIVIAPSPSEYAVNISTTSHFVNITMLAVQGDTLLGSTTSCAAPLLPSCLDISGQSCSMGALDGSCLPRNVTFDTLYVNNIELPDGAVLTGVCNVNDTLEVIEVQTNNLILQGSMSCPNPSTGINQNCLNLDNYTCPLGMPLADSCIPANLTFYDLSVTHMLNVNLLQCNTPLDVSTCLIPLSGDVTGPISNTTVVKLQGVPIDATPPLNQALFVYDGTKWSGNVITWNDQLVPNTVVARDESGNINVNALSASLIQPPLSGSTCLVLGGAAGLCAKSDVSLGYNSLTNVNNLYVDNIYGTGTLDMNTPLITVNANLQLTSGVSLIFNNVTGFFSTTMGILETNAALVVSNVLTASRYIANSPLGVPTVVAGTGAGTGPTVTVTSGSNDCKMQVTVLTGTAPAANTIFTITYRTAATGTLANGVIFSVASATSAALTGTSAPWISAEALGTFTFRSGTVALSAATTYVWNFQTCA